jgi:hypothetical protein
MVLPTRRRKEILMGLKDNAVEAVMDEWARRSEQMYENRTAGDHSHIGLLAGFLMDIDLVRNAEEKTVAHLVEGDYFSLDGKTWHKCCVVLFGSVAVYAGSRDLTERIDAAWDDKVLVR